MPFLSRFHILTLVLVLAAVLTAGCSPESVTAQVERVARVAQPAQATDQSVHVYPGQIRARYESSLGFRVDGKISARRVDLGAKVRRDQILAELDSRDLVLASMSTRATLGSAQAALKLAQSEHVRYASLRGRNFVSQFELDAKVNALEAARAQVSESRAALDSANNQAGYAALRADADGVITAVSAEVGQVVGAGQVVFVLARDGDTEVEIDVPEQQVGAHAIGQPASIELWTENGVRQAGIVREIAPAADPTTRTYRMRIALKDTGATPRLGQTARVYFGTSADANQWLVPLAAVYEKDGKPALWVVDPQTRAVHLDAVGVERYAENGALINAGIDGESWIVTAGVHRLREGEVISPIDSQNRRITF